MASVSNTPYPIYSFASFSVNPGTETITAKLLCPSPLILTMPTHSFHSLPQYYFCQSLGTLLSTSADFT